MQETLNNLQILCHRMKIAQSLCINQNSEHKLDFPHTRQKCLAIQNFLCHLRDKSIIFLYNEKFPDQSQKFPDTGPKF